jgi:hypothetical protein
MTITETDENKADLMIMYTQYGVTMRLKLQRILNHHLVDKQTQKYGPHVLTNNLMDPKLFVTTLRVHLTN